MTEESCPTLEEARRLILARTGEGETEFIPLADSLDKRAATPLRAQLAVPHFRQSTMDGYAVRGDDLTGEGPWRLTLDGEIAAGCTHIPPLGAQRAYRVMTGAALPARADRVIPQELCAMESRTVILKDKGRRGGHIRAVGTDLRKGQVIVGKGQRITPFQLHLLATSGLRTIPVFRAPCVAHLSTGSELVEENPCPGQIISGNRALLHGLILRAGALPRDLGSSPDTALEIAARISATQQPAIVVTTGGMGPGKYDFTGQALRQAGVTILYDAIQVRPGRSTLFGVRGATLFFALPGPPPAVHLLFQELVLPAILAMQGWCRKPTEARALLDREIRINSTGQLNLKAARITMAQGRLHARPAALTEAANGAILVPAGRRRLRAGEKVRIRVYD